MAFSSGLNAWDSPIQTTGRYFFVAPGASYTYAGQAFSASDSNDGLHPKRALLTLAQAVTNATASVGDVIVLLPGAHTTAAALAVSKAGLTFIGMPYLNPSAQRQDGYPQASITGTAAIAVAVTAADATFINIKFIPITQFQAVTFTTAADRLRFKHCSVDLTGVTGHANTKGICATGATQAPRGLRLQGCYMKAGVATTSSGYLLDVGAALDIIMENCFFFHDGFVASAAAYAVAVKINDAANGCFRDNEFVSANVAVAVTKWIEAVSMTGAGTFQMIRNTMMVNTSGLLFDDFAAADVDLLDNRIATVAGGTGGTLITATT